LFIATAVRIGDHIDVRAIPSRNRISSGPVEVDDKPDILGERPDLERLHAVLTEEFEIHERKIALELKLSLVSQTTETVVGLIENARTLRVEWYIVILIVLRSCFGSMR